MPIESAEVEVRATFPQLGKYGLDPEGGAAMEGLEWALELRSGAPPERVAALVETAERYCHAAQSLRANVSVRGTLVLNGERVPLATP